MLTSTVIYSCSQDTTTKLNKGNSGNTNPKPDTQCEETLVNKIKDAEAHSKFLEDYKNQTPEFYTAAINEWEQARDIAKECKDDNAYVRAIFNITGYLSVSGTSNHQQIISNLEEAIEVIKKNDNNKEFIYGNLIDDFHMHAGRAYSKSIRGTKDLKKMFYHYAQVIISEAEHKRNGEAHVKYNLGNIAVLEIMTGDALKYPTSRAAFYSALNQFPQNQQDIVTSRIQDWAKHQLGGHYQSEARKGLGVLGLNK